MSDQATIFELPYNLFLMQRMEFVVICGDHLAANIMRIIEVEMIKRKEAWQVRVEEATEKKKPLPKEPKTWWVRLSQSQIIARLYMYDTAKLKKPESEDLQSQEWVEYRYKRALSISKATLKKAIELLKALGFLVERSKPGDEFGAPIYTLNKENVQAAIKKLPSNPFAIFHALGGVENFDSGGDSKNFNVPPKNYDSGDSKNLTVPPQEFSSGESKNFRVDIDSSIDIPLDEEIDNEIEGTYSDVPENATRAIAQPAPDASSSEPYHPDYTASQARSEQDSVAGDARSQQARTAGGPVQAIGYEKPVQSTSQVTTPRQSARQAPTFSNAPLFAPTKPARPTLTAEGKLVREWYQVIRSTRVRLTDDNINACNGLSEEDGISFEALKEAIEYWDEDKYVKDHEIAIDLQKLEDPKGAFTFAKAMLILRKRKKPANTAPKPTTPKPSDNPYDLANIMAMRPLPTTGAAL